MQKFISGTPLDDVRTTRMFSSILKQCAEKIDRTRITGDAIISAFCTRR